MDQGAAPKTWRLRGRALDRHQEDVCQFLQQGPADALHPQRAPPQRDWHRHPRRGRAERLHRLRRPDLHCRWLPAREARGVAGLVLGRQLLERPQGRHPHPRAHALAEADLPGLRGPGALHGPDGGRPGLRLGQERLRAAGHRRRGEQGAARVHGAALRDLRGLRGRGRQLHARADEARRALELGPLPGLQLPARVHEHMVQRLRVQGRAWPQGHEAGARARGGPAHGRADQGGQALHLGLQRLRPAGLGPARRGPGGPAEAEPGQGAD
mmetsp:Transcript_16299/g.47688  ORF Transcript_16299/g.47688 Transcript_16299/m.47688 type:complete len:269 (-) Transcript_16299:745-1551(-)